MSVCRVCLSSSLRLQSVQNELISVYDNLTNSKFNIVIKPRVVCSYCHQKLLKCYTFSRQAQRSEQILNQLLSKGVLEVTEEIMANSNSSCKPQYSTSPLRFYNITENEEFCTQIKIEAVDESQEPTTSSTPINTSGLHEIFIKSEPVEVNQERSDEEYILGTDSIDNSAPIRIPDSIRSMETESFDGFNHFIAEPQVQITEPNYIIDVANSSGKKPKGPFTCPECGKVYTYRSDYTIHMRKHTGEKPYACSLCDKKVSFKSHLVSHMRVHNNEKPFSCSVCGAAFYQRSHMQAHTRIHTGEKPYACSLCNEQFAYRRAFVGHMRTHTGEKKPFCCTLCDKSFSIKREMEDHVRTHTGERPFDCPECVKKFRCKSHLMRHLRIHTGEKPHACPECDKKFIEKQSLISHMYIHTGEKLFACMECDKKFSQKSNLTSHMKTHGEKTQTSADNSDSN